MHTITELQRWEAVPRLVVAYYKEAADLKSKLLTAIKPLSCMPGYGHLWWHPEKKAVCAVLGDSDDQAVHDTWKTALAQVPGVTTVETSAETPPPRTDGWIRLKSAAALSGLGNVWSMANNALGGPSAMSSAIAGGLLAGGVGYGVGTLAEQVLPERYFERNKLRRTLGLLGLGLGALPGLHKGTAHWRNSADAGKPLGWSSFITPDADVPTPPENNAKLAAAIKLATGEMDFSETGGDRLDSVPVDAFNQAVWVDVRKGIGANQNPWGTKNPYGTNEQDLHTTPTLGAMTTGLTSGIQAMYGGTPVLPVPLLVRGLVGAGVGLATANITGRVLGAMAGLRPEAQNKLQDMGLWAGMLTAVVPPLFGR